MNTLLRRLILAALFSLLIGWAVHPGKEEKQALYRPALNPTIFIAFPIAIAIAPLLVIGSAPLLDPRIPTVLLLLMVYMSLYYGLLLPLLPRLRRRNSARACAALWVLPMYLSYYELYIPAPKLKWVLRLPLGLLQGLFLLWLAGFCAVMLWKLGGHLCFRRRILRPASPVYTPAVTEIWREEWLRSGQWDAKHGIPASLCRSPAVASPLSIGLFRATTRVVLPQREYAPEDLRLILRHEILHITRRDCWSKFFLTFCTAFCWINPLMWIAMGKSAEDLELSCDEAVLHTAEEDERRRYASLVLTTAGDSRGFTSCLSASAEALRYRLRHIVEPRRRRSGALMVGAACFLLFLSGGQIAVAYESGSGEEYIYQGLPTEGFSVSGAVCQRGGYRQLCVLRHEAAFHRYMATLPMERVSTGRRDVEGDWYFHYEGPRGTVVVELEDRGAKVTRLYGEAGSEQYYLPEGVDWERLAGCFDVFPALNLRLERDGDAYGHDASASLWQVSAADGALLYDSESVRPGGIIVGGPLYERAVMDFSDPPTGPVTVTVEALDGSGSYTEQLGADESVPLAPYSARYTFRAPFDDGNGGAIYALFVFDQERGDS